MTSSNMTIASTRPKYEALAKIPDISHPDFPSTKGLSLMNQHFQAILTPEQREYLCYEYDCLYLIRIRMDGDKAVVYTVDLVDKCEVTKGKKEGATYDETINITDGSLGRMIHGQDSTGQDEMQRTFDRLWEISDACKAVMNQEKREVTNLNRNAKFYAILRKINQPYLDWRQNSINTFFTSAMAEQARTGVMPDKAALEVFIETGSWPTPAATVARTPAA